MSQAPTDMRSEYGSALVAVGEANSRVVVLGADTTDSLKTARFGNIFPDRFFNVGIAEANMVSVAAGLAASGMTVFASTYAIFVPGRAVDQIRNAICYPTRDRRKGLDVKLVVSHGGLSVGADGGSHQQIEDIAIMRTIPNMRVLIPADAVSVGGLVHRMVETYGPFYMRIARSKVPPVHDGSQKLRIGKAVTIRDGPDCTIAACGITVSMALKAAEQLRKEGISCRVLDLFSVKPIDEGALEDAARQTGSIVTCEEHNVMAGMGSAVAEIVSERYPVPVKRIGVLDRFGESCRDSEISRLLAKHKIAPVNIAEAVRDARRSAS